MRNEDEKQVEEFYWGKVVARRWGEQDGGWQGLRIGFYDEDGEFSTMVIVEEDRMEGGESQMKALVWEDDGDRDPDANIGWIGPEPCGGPEGESRSIVG